MRATKIILSLSTLFSLSTSYANIVGTDVQNFNPTTNGLDFVTVQSSETLQPGLVNVGLFLNYSGNTLAYTRSVSGQVTGKKPGDRILGMDLNMGLGLTENWDVGFSLPAVLTQELKETTGVARYNSQGLTEVRANTKYRLWGDAKGGVAAVFSINNSLIRDNPFIGKNAGPTLNYELVADTTLAEKFGVAVNVGYRQRNSGKPIASFPFQPFENQYIYSVAGNYLMSSIDTKLIAEIFASQPEKKVTYTKNRSQSTLESLVGLKHDYTPSLALHAGIGSQLQKSVASPEWRIYAGLNYVFGPVWKKKEKDVAEVESSQKGKRTKQFRIRGEVLFEFNSAEIKQEAYEPLRLIAEDLKMNGFKHLTIEGHTDSVGNDDYNLRLSQRRSESVKEHFTRIYKLDGQRITPIGKGESEPIADNGNYQGRRENRRVEFVVEKD